MRNPTKGEYLYLNPDTTILEEEFEIDDKIYSLNDLLSVKFLIISETSSNITIDWFGRARVYGKVGVNIWEGDWTEEYITEYEYRRTNNLNILLNNLD